MSRPVTVPDSALPYGWFRVKTVAMQNAKPLDATLIKRRTAAPSSLLCACLPTARLLLLHQEKADRHRYLASLPPRNCDLPTARPEVKRQGWSMQYIRDFLLAYCSCFLAVSLFIL